MNNPVDKEAQLVYDLPCIEYGEDYLVYSPSQKVFLKVPKVKINTFDFHPYRENQENIKSERSILNVGFTVTTRCNLSCKHCYAKKDNIDKDMSTDLARGIFSSLFISDFDCLLFSFFGGEPTLNIETIKEVVHLVKESSKPHHFHITTNGVMEENALAFITSNRMDVTLSLDGVPSINNEIRCSKLNTNVSDYIEKAIYEFNKNGILYQIRTTISEINILHLRELVDYCASLGVNYIHFEPVSIEGNAERNNFTLPSPDLYVERIIDIVNYCSDKGIYIISSPYMNLVTPSKYFCTSAYKGKLNFNPDGSISSCYKAQSKDTKWDNFIVGLFDERSKVIQMNEIKQNYLKKLSFENNKMCYTCFAKYFCGLGCPQRNLMTSGSMSIPDDWSCYTRKSLIKDALIKLYESSKKNYKSVLLGTFYYEKEILDLLQQGGTNGD